MLLYARCKAPRLRGNACDNFHFGPATISSFNMPSIYCERVGDGLLAEPLNAFTNVAFVLSAWQVWRLADRMGAMSPRIRLLCLLSVAIGAGSTLFHTWPTEWTRWFDFVPILLFQVAFFCFFLGRNRGGVLSVIVITSITLIDKQFPGALNGSAVYAPAILALVALWLFRFATAQPEALLLLIAASVFSLSLLLRTIDLEICRFIPVGTHFLWHMLNSLLLYLLMRSLIVAHRSAPDRR